mmetsp:Transcript_121498/g.222657  ORF Transcript_121498/g.222657 Transcript_121498/m.222657 type:complete len:443 (+) Transcript_121498:33-1361(+)
METVLAMRSFALVLACLAGACHARKVQLGGKHRGSVRMPQPMAGCQQEAAHVGEPSPMQAIARFLLACSPSSGWQAFAARRGCQIAVKDQRGSRSGLQSVVAQLPGSSKPRLAVFGGRGFIGSRVCRTLIESGCEVVSISLSGMPPSWAKDEPWVQEVQWLSVDEADKSLGALDSAISCVGNLRPNSNWTDFFGLRWDFPRMQRQNGDVNEQIAEAAKRAGAQRFTYVSVSSDVSYAYGGALMGYIKGKRQGEDAARRLFGDRATIVGPSLVYGGGRFAAPGAVYEAITSSGPVKLLVNILRKLNAISLNPSDRINIIALSPPVDVDTAARAIAAGALGSTTLGFINGTADMKKVAAEDADADSLKAAATELARKRSPAQAVQLLAGAITGKPLPQDGAPSDLEAPFEGAFVGARPFLFPLPIALAFIALVLSFPRVPAKPN